MDARQFHNALRILLNVDVARLREAGVIDENWGAPEASERDQIEAFRENPFREAIRMPDDNFDRLFALIEARQPRPRPVISIHFLDHEDRSGEIA